MKCATRYRLCCVAIIPLTFWCHRCDLLLNWNPFFSRVQVKKLVCDRAFSIKIAHEMMEMPQATHFEEPTGFQCSVAPASLRSVLHSQLCCHKTELGWTVHGLNGSSLHSALLKIRLAVNVSLMSAFYLTHTYVTPLAAASCCQQPLPGCRRKARSVTSPALCTSRLIFSTRLPWLPCLWAVLMSTCRNQLWV